MKKSSPGSKHLVSKLNEEYMATLLLKHGAAVIYCDFFPFKSYIAGDTVYSAKTSRTARWLLLALSIAWK